MVKAQILEFDRRSVLAPVQPDERNGSISSRYRTSLGEGHGRQGARPGVQVGAEPRCLDRAGPTQHSSGGKDRLGSITKQGDRIPARAVHRWRDRRHPICRAARYGRRPWLTALLARRPTKVAAIALANKLARMTWAIMASGERYREPARRQHNRDRSGRGARGVWEGKQHAMQSRSKSRIRKTHNAP